MLRVVPTGAALGAEIHGVNLSADLDGTIIDAIRCALLEHLLLIFRAQELTPLTQARFARRFGALQRHGFLDGLNEQPEVLAICKEPQHLQNFGGCWHTDNSYLRNPPLGAILYAIQVPTCGGDTLWANQQAAYLALPKCVKSGIDALHAVHSAEPAFGSLRLLPDVANQREQELRDTATDVVHPLVRMHPESHRKSLFHSGLCTVRLAGRTIQESKPLLDQLLTHATQEHFNYRHRWRAHDVLFWDNRCTMHCALNDYPNELRIVHRVSIAGDRPGQT